MSRTTICNIAHLFAEGAEVWKSLLVWCFCQGLVLIPTEDAPSSDYAGADERYLMLHINPARIPCGTWYVTAETSMGSC